MEQINVLSKAYNPQTDVYVGHGIPSKKIKASPWGSRFTGPECLSKYRDWVTKEIAEGRLNLEDLRGKRLVCCSSKNCHAKILHELLDGKTAGGVNAQKN